MFCQSSRVHTIPVYFLLSFRGHMFVVIVIFFCEVYHTARRLLDISLDDGFRGQRMPNIFVLRISFQHMPNFLKIITDHHFGNHMPNVCPIFYFAHIYPIHAQYDKLTHVNQLPKLEFLCRLYIICTKTLVHF